MIKLSLNADIKKKQRSLKVTIMLCKGRVIFPSHLDLITTLTYVLMDYFFPLISCIFEFENNVKELHKKYGGLDLEYNNADSQKPILQKQEQ